MQPYQVIRDGRKLGNFSDSEIPALLASGRLEPADLCWTEGMDHWQPLSERVVRPPHLPPPLPGSHQPVARLEDSFGMRMLIPVGRSGWAIAAGYMGLFSLLLVPAPLALVISLVAIARIRDSRKGPTPKHGMGRAIFGLIMGLLGTTALVLLLAKS